MYWLKRLSNIFQLNSYSRSVLTLL
uniref:Uncharacterized protein n=1 Tax=Anguilla anguilla TaxID=7936 RepID=A0A0E9PDI2_ANGAN